MLIKAYDDYKQAVQNFNYAEPDNVEKAIHDLNEATSKLYSVFQKTKEDK